MAAALTSMLKMAAPPERSTSEKVGDSEGGDSIGDEELVKKSGKSSKI